MILITTLATTLLATTSCGRDAEPVIAPTTPTTLAPVARDQLAGVAAAAKDKRYVTNYTLAVANRADRTVTVAMATDGTWVVAVPGAALSGLADIAIYRSGAGVFQCTLGAATGTAGTRPDLEPITPGCVAAATLAPTVDPQVQHVFTNWIDALVDRDTALSVAATANLPGARGACFSIESTSAALAPPVDPGVYCYEPDGLLTAARAGFGTLTQVGPVSAGPPSVTMPGPVVTRALLPITAPARPKPPPTPAAPPAL